MRYINILGDMNSLDNLINNYLTRHDIQLENESSTIDTSLNTYESYFEKAKKYVQIIGENVNSYKMITINEALNIIDNMEKAFCEKDEILKDLEIKKQEIMKVISQFEKFINLEFTVSQLDNFKFITYKFGKIPIANYLQLNSFLYDLKELIFIESKRDDIYVYGIYFVPEVSEKKVDEILLSLNFRKDDISFKFDDISFSGSFKDSYNILKNRLLTIQDKISIIQEQKLDTIGVNKSDIVDAYSKIKSLYYSQSIKRYLKKVTNNFFMFSGWIPETDTYNLEIEIKREPNLILIMDTTYKAENITPPTKLKNNKLFEPFEFLVKIYGIPKYNEIDPTPFVAITYTVLFGIMFGDLGQGALISILGLYLYKKRDMPIGKIMLIIGVSSMFFGGLYGSVFGFEHLIKTFWLKPTENINQILYISILIGILLIIIAILFNIINGIRQKDKIKLYLGPNSVVGLIFYLSTASLAYLMLNEHVSKVITTLGAVSVISIVIIALKEPIKSKLITKKQVTTDSLPIYILETIIETFEIILAYFTNTLSFIRVGAFALSHAGMMSVVMLLSYNMDGSHNFLVIAIGNLVVIALEGLVVGIQVLRIQFYELFSRYYKSGGKEFKPCKNLDSVKFN